MYVTRVLYSIPPQISTRSVIWETTQVEMK